MNMTHEQMRAEAARLAGLAVMATPAPWIAVRDSMHFDMATDVVAATAKGQKAVAGTNHETDALFISSAHSAYDLAAQVPALLDRIAEAEAAAKTWEAEANRRSQRFTDEYASSRLAEVQQRLDAAMGRIAELERDAERYRIATEKYCIVEMHGDGSYTPIFDEDLDAAMQAHTKEGGK